MSSNPDVARRLIDAAHSRDPKLTPDGSPAELVYADRVEAWARKLAPQGGDLLFLAARCQHLERFDVPRSTFPMDKPGYHAWRRSLYVRQSQRCRDLLIQAGYADAEASNAARWVAKDGLKSDSGTQALEDAACLVFLENEIGDFAAQHADYPREKFVEILRKTWRKMSPAAQAEARALPLPPAISAWVREALA